MRSTHALLDAMRKYGEALDAGCDLAAWEAQAMEEGLAALLVKVRAQQEPYVDNDHMPAEAQIYPLDR